MVILSLDTRVVPLLPRQVEATAGEAMVEENEGDIHIQRKMWKIIWRMIWMMTYGTTWEMTWPEVRIAEENEADMLDTGMEAE